MSVWDKRTDETPKAYRNFTLYRDLGPERSLEKAGQVLGKTKAALEQLSDKYDWVARCDQWDAHVRQIHDRAFLTETARKGRQRAQAFTALLGKCLKALKNVET